MASTPRRARPAYRLTRRGWGLAVGGALVAVAGGVLSLPDLLALGVAGVVAVVACAVWLGATRIDRGRHAVRARRSFAPDPVARRRTTTAHLVVQAAGRPRGAAATMAGLRVGEQAAPELCQDAALRAAVHREGPTMTVSYVLAPPRRGRWPVGPLVAERTDALGLVSSRQHLGARTTLTVRPAVVALPVRAAGVLAESHRTSSGSGSASPEDTLVREYTVGDDPRRVHWRSAARHGRLMVRAEESAGLPEATVLLDPGLLLGTTGSSSHEPAEWAVDLAASIALSLLGAGFRVRLVGPECPDDAFGFAAPRTTQGSEHLLDVATDLADPTSTGAASATFDGSVAQIRATRRRGELVHAIVSAGAAATAGLVALGTSGPTHALVVHPGPRPDQDVARTVATLAAAGHHATTVPAGADIEDTWSRVVSAASTAGGPR